MGHRISGFLLATVKWPAALTALLLLPAAAATLLRSLGRLAHAPAVGVPLALGVSAYGLVWLLAFRRARITWLATLVHELTHCLFALLTLNKVTGLRATFSRGGHMTFVGTPNWLILLAPYFFPTVTVTLLLLRPVVASGHGLMLLSLVGASIAYHGFSTWTQIHPGQNDLRQAGLTFCWLLLPTLNLLVLSLVITWIHTGPASTVDVIRDLWRSPFNPLASLARA
jgi:Peptidase M50B-like